MKNEHLPSATSSLYDANPVASGSDAHLKNTNPLPEEGSPYDEGVTGEPDEAVLGAIEGETGAIQMIYDPIDQDHTTNP